MGRKIDLITFVFEKIANGEYRNFIDCPDINDSGLPRFGVSPLILELEKKTRKNDIDFVFQTEIPNGKYVIPTSVAHSPNDWTGNNQFSERRSLFFFLNGRYLNDLQDKKAFLLLDQSHEGYHSDWLFSWFHAELVEYNISPSQVIYVTGNMKCEEQYKEFTRINLNNNKIKVLPYTHFELAISRISEDKHIPSFKENLRYKKSKINDIKLYNCLQKRPRNHRMWLFLKLFESDLLEEGINSMNRFSKIKTHLENYSMESERYNKIKDLLPILPPNDDPSKLDEFSSGNCGSYLNRLNEDMALRSWFTIVSEALYGDLDETCFLSEKTFKPIACGHPFIIYGNRNSLEYLRYLGYRTFHPYINENYDQLPTWNRLDAIIKEIKRLSMLSTKGKISLYKQINPIILHNQSILRNRRKKLPEYIYDFFEELEKEF